MKFSRAFLAAAAAALVAHPALAHTGAGDTAGLVAGFVHPAGGLDHVLAMIAVGVLAAQQGGRSLWLVPAAFVAMMLAGGVLGFAGVAVPFVEQGIVGSILILGFVVALGRAMPAGAAMTLVGALAVFHGHAHGTEMPLDANGALYALGFAVATALLHGAGVFAAIGAQKAVRRAAPVAVRVLGGAIAAAGAGLAVL